jgi:hypothetical protein
MKIIKKEENAYIQTSRLENPEELQPRHNHEKSLLSNRAVALCTMQN